jgi:hypothetical protein
MAKAKPQLTANEQNAWELASQFITSDIFRSERFKAAWCDWIAHRRAIRKPVTLVAVKLQIRQLEKWGMKNALASIEQSITQGWTGLFEPHDNKGEQMSGWRTVEPAEEWAKKPYRA